ncbi:MAG TPA: nitrate/nitrite transporter NrtS [Thermoleophilaceae bacterium]|nr:nitrate/nitrite transporter NrtS [Thermoleophilaceae bacterium]
MRDAIDIVLRPEHLRKTLKIAFIVGCVLTTINQLDVYLRGDATALIYLKTGLNFCVPFVVSNLGLLAGKRAEAEGATAAKARTESGVMWAPDPPDA